MNRLEKLVIGIDPGAEHVGVSMSRGKEEPTTFIWPRVEFIQNFETTTVSRIAMERFDMRQFTLDSMATVKLIGVIEYLCVKRGIAIGYVNAADKAKFLPEIRRNYPEIKSHALDAEAVRLWDLEYGNW